jgi:hypothetical protein
MLRHVTWVSALWCAAALAAQQSPPDPAPGKPATAAERLDALKAAAKKLTEDFQATAREAQGKAKAAQAEGKPVAAMPMRPDFAPLVAEAAAAAKEFAGGDDAVPFLMFVVQNGGVDKDGVATALGTLAERHLDHASVVAFAPMMQFLPRLVGDEHAPAIRERFLRSTNPDVRAWATFGGHRAAIEKAERDSDDYAKARAALVAAADAAADVRVKREIQAALDLREKLSVGNVAPDIEGTDLDGVAFKLSDYKGKVVFLDFWGDW